MDFYGKYKSPLGYQTGENHIDSYGVDHSGFTFAWWAGLSNGSSAKRKPNY